MKELTRPEKVVFSIGKQEGNDLSIPFKIAGIPDEYTMTGSQLEIFKSYGLTAEGLSDTAIRLIA